MSSLTDGQLCIQIACLGRPFVVRRRRRVAAHNSRRRRQWRCWMK